MEKDTKANVISIKRYLHEKSLASLNNRDFIYGFDRDSKEVLFVIDFRENKIIQKNDIAVVLSDDDFKVRDIDGKLYVID